MSHTPPVDSKGAGKLWFLWRFIPHSHRTDNMRFMGMYRPGHYEIWECIKCKFTEAI